MERKVTEWGCMQALIDYDGWRKWKQYAKPKANEDPAKRAQEEKEEKARARAALKAAFSRPPPTATSSSSIAAPTATPAATAAMKRETEDREKEKADKSMSPTVPQTSLTGTGTGAGAQNGQATKPTSLGRDLPIRIQKTTRTGSTNAVSLGGLAATLEEEEPPS